MKSKRQSEIASILKDGRRVTAAELAEYFDVTVRTIYRDITALNIRGISIEAVRGKGGGIHLTGSIPAGELAGPIPESQSDPHMAQPDARSADWLDIEFSHWLNSREMQRKFSIFRQCILQRRVASMSYYTISRGAQQRTVEPCRLTLKGNSWHVLAYCRERKGYRSFKLSRISDLTVTSEVFADRGDIPSERQRSSSRPQKQALVLRIRPEAVERIRDDFDAELITALADGNYRLVCGVYDPEDAVAYVMSYGAAVECLQPLWLRSRIAGEVSGMQRQYL